MKRKDEPIMKTSTRRRWTVDEEKYLEGAYGSKPTSEIARELDRSETSIRIMAHRLGLKGSWNREPEALKMWSPEEDAILRTEFATTSVQLLSKRLNRTETTIYKRAQAIGVRARD